MDTDPFENLSIPDVRQPPPREVGRHIYEPRAAASLGAWMVSVPGFFLFCVFMKFFFHKSLHVFAIIQEFVAAIDGQTHKITVPVIFVGFPIIGFVVNTLAIANFYYMPSTSELLISVRMRWINLMLMAACASIVGIFLLYAIAENFTQTR